MKKLKTKNNRQEFDTNLSTGLDQSEVENRLKLYGYNEVMEKKTNTLLKKSSKNITEH